MVIGAGDGEVRTELFVPNQDSEDAVWNGRRLDREEALERSGADAAHPWDELGQVLPELLKAASGIHYRLGSGPPELDRMVREALDHRRRGGARGGIGPEVLADPGRVLDGPRLRKDEWELVRMRRAIDITVDAFRETLSRARPGMAEYELQAVLEAAFMAAGSEARAFPSIVGAGPNACVLHYIENRARIREGDLVLVDAGATCDLYCGDLTRTFPVSGHFSTAQLDLYQVVEGARAAAVAVVGPGVAVEEVHRVAVRRLVEGLVELRIVEGEVDAVVEAESYRRYYPHRTSHWLGLDVHDVGDYATREGATILEPGMVLTVEPGLYLPPGSTNGAAPFAGIGIRIEDDILVTAEGSENLSDQLPTAPDALADLVAG